MECLNCKTPVAQTAGKRPKLYCSETCRVAFFRQKKAGEGVKKGKGRPRKHIIVHPKKVYDASKLPDYTMDEAGKYAVGVDPHSKGPSKGKTVVYKKGSKKDPISSEEAVAIYNAEHPEQHSEIESAKKYNVSLPDGTYPDVEKELEQKVATYLAESTTPEMRAETSKIAQEKVFGPSWKGKAKVTPVKDPVSLDLPAFVRKAEQDTRKVLNPDDPKTKQKKEPAEGTNAFYLKYGAFTKKDILK